MNKHVQNWIEIAKEIVLDKIDLENFNIFLFGSYARGDFEQGSDIDIGVLGKEKIDLQVIEKIKEAVDNSIIPNKVDIVDFYRVSEDFKKEAMKDIKIWNKAKNIHLN